MSRINLGKTTQRFQISLASRAVIAVVEAENLQNQQL